MNPPQHHIFLNDAVKTLRDSEIKHPKDDIETAWNAELEKIIRKLCLLPNPNPHATP